MIFPFRKMYSDYRSRGFTLLELAVVVFIIGLLAALAVPAFNDNATSRLNDSADRLVLLINQARQEAVLSSRIWQLVIDPVSDTYYFRKRVGSQFEQENDGPFAAVNTRPSVEFYNLVINNQQSTSMAEISLFPTGEQDTLSLSLKAGEHKRTVMMGPVGPAEVRMQ